MFVTSEPHKFYSLPMRIVSIVAVLLLLTPSAYGQIGRVCSRNTSVNFPPNEQHHTFVGIVLASACENSCLNDPNCGCFLWTGDRPDWTGLGFCWLYSNTCDSGPLRGGTCHSFKIPTNAPTNAPTKTPTLVETADCTDAPTQVDWPTGLGEYAANVTANENECKFVCGADRSCMCWRFELIDGVNMCYRFGQFCPMTAGAGAIRYKGGNCGISTAEPTKTPTKTPTVSPTNVPTRAPTKELSVNRTCTGTAEWVDLPTGNSLILRGTVMDRNTCKLSCESDISCQCWMHEGVERSICSLYRSPCNLTTSGMAFGGNCATERSCVQQSDLTLSMSWMATIYHAADCQSECRSRDTCGCYMEDMWEPGQVCVLYSDASKCDVKGGGLNGGKCVPVVTAPPTRAPSRLLPM